MRKMAILGGTFDPVHWGHLLMAEAAVTLMNLDRVIWIPDRYPPHKQAVGFEHRQLMVQQAIASNPAFVLSPVDTQRIAPAYAVETLLNLQEIYPQIRWYWIIGLDAFKNLPRWYRHQDLAPACDWLVAPRALPMTANQTKQEAIDSQVDTLCQQVAQKFAEQNVPIRWEVLPMPLVDISSSLIRRYCRDRFSIRYLVPEAVRIYIATHNLYAD